MSDLKQRSVLVLSQNLSEHAMSVRGVVVAQDCHYSARYLKEYAIALVLLQRVQKTLRELNESFDYQFDDKVTDHALRNDINAFLLQ